jgi:2-C-methyl-D-erythritol 4-phosphate cytidylyltransferase
MPRRITEPPPLRYHAIIPAAGNGSRFSEESPKQYWPLEGKPVLQHVIERLTAAFPLHGTYVALAAGDAWFERTLGTCRSVTTLRCGGKTRAQTVHNALEALTGVAHDDWILVHDAVRPCVDTASLLRLKNELADDNVGGFLAVPVTGTLKRADHDKRSMRTESREHLWVAQTPQMFRYSVLHEALSRPGVEQVTDEAQAVEALGARPIIVAGCTTNVKITYRDDLDLAAAILAAERLRRGSPS